MRRNPKPGPGSRDPTLAGDLTGGVVSALMLLPSAVAFGALIFEPLGPGYVSAGVIAGLLGVCFANLGSAARVGVRVMINGPYSLSALMQASMLTIILAGPGGPGGAAAAPAAGLAVFFVVLAAAGAIQVSIGLLRLGFITKYIPYPVLSGLLCGTSIVLILTQVRGVLGIDRGAPIAGAGDLWTRVQLPTLAVAAITVAGTLNGKRISRKIPAPLIGLGLGTAAYYGLQLAGFGDRLGPTIGHLPSTIPRPSYLLEGAAVVTDPALLAASLKLLPLALGVAAVSSFRAMIVTASVDTVARTRSDTNRELVGQGLGNLLSAFFGGISTTGHSTSLANHRFGARSRLSRVAAGGFALATIILFAPAVAYLPRAVLAAMLVFLGIITFDRWAVRQVGRLVGEPDARRSVASELFIVVLVVSVMVFVGIFEAVAVGALAALAVMATKMARDTIRRDFTAQVINSAVHRAGAEKSFLGEHGDRIRVLELEGVLFFGNTDRLLEFIDTTRGDRLRTLILDLKRVTEIDSSGDKALENIGVMCREAGISFLVSSLDPGLKTGSFLSSLPAAGAAADDRTVSFDTLDRALAWAEDLLLAETFGDDRYQRQTPLASMRVLRELDPEQLERFTGYLDKLDFGPGCSVFEQGDATDGVYFIAAGRVHVVLQTRLGKTRLSTMTPGMTFGEMSVLNREPRSAAVVAEGTLTCYHLSVAALDRMLEERPALAFAFLQGIARDLAQRVRFLDRVANELKA